MTVIHRRYQIEALEIASLEYGEYETADISVVFLHGWLDNAASFSSVMAELNCLSPNLHLCAFDLPGHGHSDHKSGSNFYSFHDYLDDVYQILINFRSNRVVLVGHSLGALIASCYSAAFPEQVSGLVQIEGYGPLAEAEDNTFCRIKEGIVSRQRIRKKPMRTIASLQDAVDRRSKVNAIAPNLIAPVVERGVMQLGEQWTWRHDVKLQSQSLYRMSLKHVQYIRQNITCPQLIVLGNQGFSHLHIFQQDASELTQFAVIDGGHHCHLQLPSRVAGLIFGLLNKI